MIIREASINQAGVDEVLRLADSPRELGLVDTDDYFRDDSPSQLYIPGISVPSIPVLTEPFMVPIFGDNESVSITINWPRRASGLIVRQVIFVGQLPAENVTRITEVDDLITDMLNEEAELELNNEFDDYTGDFGAFLHVTTEDKGTERPGTAEFICFETEDEFGEISELLDSEKISAADFATASRLTRFNAQTDRFQLKA